MGSMIELNDTLRINQEQGFPTELDIARHLETPYALEAVEGELFHFEAKPKIRVYQQPPVRNFLVEEVNGKWVYWGLCHILEIHHDYLKQETSGTFKIIYLNSPAEMKQAFALTDQRPDFNYFS